jgi:hypothetical protein
VCRWRRNETGTYAASASVIIHCALVFCALLHPEPSTNSIEGPQPYLDTEAYEVYAPRLPDEWPWAVAHAKQLVIQQETTVFPKLATETECLPGGDDFPESWKEVLADYKKQNERTRVLARGFVIEKPYHLIPKQEVADLFKKDGPGWNGFYLRYPDSGGIIQLSAVGFNRERTKAVLYVGHSCGWLCGGGGYSFVQKKDGKWVTTIVKGVSCDWVS